MRLPVHIGKRMPLFRVVWRLCNWEAGPRRGLHRGGAESTLVSDATDFVIGDSAKFYLAASINVVNPSTESSQAQR